MIAWLTFKTFPNDNSNVAKMAKWVFDRAEITARKGENGWSPASFLFPTMFSKVYFLRVLESQDCVLKG